VFRHLALAVTDVERSRDFYERRLGFGALPAKLYDDGVLMLFDGRGSALALQPTDRVDPLPEFVHFGYVLDSRAEAEEAIRRYEADGLELLERHELDFYVSCKIADPDGYVVEVLWEEGWELPG
jgi:catechol 2,3-dioxygenase-like lactoylglutathione lyase family enzyme